MNEQKDAERRKQKEDEWRRWEDEHPDVLQQAWLRGFTEDMMVHCWAARVKATGKPCSLPQLYQAIASGEFDYMLQDNSGQSYS